MEITFSWPHRSTPLTKTSSGTAATTCALSTYFYDMKYLLFLGKNTATELQLNNWHFPADLY